MEQCAEILGAISGSFYSCRIVLKIRKHGGDAMMKSKEGRLPLIHGVQVGFQQVYILGAVHI